MQEGAQEKQKEAKTEKPDDRGGDFLTFRELGVIIISAFSKKNVQEVFLETTGGKFADKPERVDKFFGLLEARLQKTKFLVRDEPTIADFHGVFAFEWVHKIDPGKSGGIDAGKFPKLAGWWKSIAEVPAVKKMKTSGVQMIP